MKAKLILVLTYDKGIPVDRLDHWAEKFKEQAKRWAADPDDPVLGILVPEGIKISGYAVPEEALTELPEIMVRVEREVRKVRGLVEVNGIREEMEVEVDAETYRKVTEGSLAGYSIGGSVKPGDSDAKAPR